ncbi:flavodoxin domain-containing protein [Clostridium sp. BJN0001]|uniref:flavodoxin domain-containing protein n=1 Tax=Clostridium sp. BJN0001 TaxID=2930219 RepID=UPI001FD547C0|nr:flavodoxin domain-containing protein [Clostridium sp. BJN0001]
MKKVNIIYWSLGGNVEFLANKIAETAEKFGAKINTLQVTDASLNDVIEADALAFGCPAYDSMNIEKKDMLPFIESLNKLKKEQTAKDCILFGTCGWIETTFMDIWKEKMQKIGFNVLDTVVIKESPGKGSIELIEKLGERLAK